jgi:hypothetical protein
VRWRSAVVCAVLLARPWTCSGQNQDDANPWFVRSGVTADRIVSRNPFAPTASQEGGPIDGGNNFTFEIGRQTDGSQAWHPLYGMPSYGFGLSLSSFRNDVAHSRPLDAYTFFSWPFAQLTDRLDVTTDFGMGLSWHWKEVDDRTNSSQPTLGSDLNAYIDWGFYLRWASTPRTVVYAGIDYTHRSNGGMVQPDQGINVLGPKVAVQYNFSPDVRSRRPVKPPPFHPSWEFLAGGAGGVKSVSEGATTIAQQNVAVLDATAGAYWHFYRFGKIAGGIDLSYDGSSGARVDGASALTLADAGQRCALGVFGGYEHVIGKFGAFLQPGFVVARGSERANSSRFYQRLGWRYHVNDHFWGSVSLRAVEGRIADALEFGAGYRLGQ